MEEKADSKDTHLPQKERNFLDLGACFRGDKEKVLVVSGHTHSLEEGRNSPIRPEDWGCSFPVEGKDVCMVMLDLGLRAVGLGIRSLEGWQKLGVGRKVQGARR